MTIPRKKYMPCIRCGTECEVESANLLGSHWYGMCHVCGDYAQLDESDLYAEAIDRATDQEQEKSLFASLVDALPFAPLDAVAGAALKARGGDK